MSSGSREECPGTSQEACTFLMGFSKHQVTLADKDKLRLSWDIHVDIMNVKSSLGCMFGNFIPARVIILQSVFSVGGVWPQLLSHLRMKYPVYKNLCTANCKKKPSDESEEERLED